MAEIKKIAVLGSGVMGSGIAAHAANAGCDVVLLDIVPEGSKNRNALAEGAIERMLKTNPAPFTHKKNAKRITPGNLEDNLDLLKDADWIIEVVLEKLEVKQAVYKKIDAVRKKGSIVSSNTSTLPLGTLTEGMTSGFVKDFLITHFFNPPRYMRLLELVAGKDTRKEVTQTIRDFADVRLGKGVVECKDTPGFIANRIGVYWLMVALLDAMKMGVTVEQADAVMGRPVGIPKTGVFGLFDLIGIDLMPLIAKSMLDSLSKDDPFCVVYDEPELVKKMIADGYTGRKGKGGFYRINKDGEKKIKESISLTTGQYAPSAKAKLESVDAAKGGLRPLFDHPDIGGKYARSVMLKVLHYAASLIPEISDDIRSVDEAMKLGYNWKYGPFELIDRLGAKEQTTGTAWIADAFKKEGLSVPAIIEKAAGKPLYATLGAKRQQMTFAGKYETIPHRPGTLMLADIKLTSKPLLKNGSASLWDLGDGVACLELTSKMNSVDPDILSLMEEVVTYLPQHKFKGLVIGCDADNFSVGANLGLLLMASNIAAWGPLSDIIRQGQKSFMGLKYAPFPVVASLAGMALGGGCEIVLHCDAVQAHVEAYPGLVEAGVGLIPGWGGCKELLLRNAEGKRGSMTTVSKVFETIALAKVGTSAEEARDMKVLQEHDRISMNRERVLADAKAFCLELAKNYTPPEPATISLPGATARAALAMAVKGFRLSGKATKHDEVVAKGLARVLSGGDTDSSETLTEQQLLDLEHEVFMQLVKEPATLARIQHMLETGKPLRN